MHLNHMGLGVTEIGPTLAMFETYFGLTRPDGFPFNDKMAFIVDDSGSLISIFRVKDVTYPKIFHLGFIQDTIAKVVAIHEALTRYGFDPEPMREEFGRTTFYFKAPGGFTIEVNSFEAPEAV